MSDTPQQYILRQPVSRDGGSDDEDFGGYYIYTGESSDAHAFIYPDGFEALFVPLDVEAKRQQIKTIIAKAQKHPSFEEKKREAENSGLSNNASFRSLQQKQLNEAVDAVLRVCGLTQESE